MSGTPFDFDPDELEDFVQEYLELDRRVQRPQGIYSILPGAREAQYQHTLKYLLHPRKSHGFRYSLLEQFLACIDFHEFNLPGQHIEIDDEVGIRDDGTAGRIDLVICGGRVLEDHPEWAVFVELKVGAPEGTEQTRTYANADTWNFDWFDSNHIDVEALAEKKYVYVKRDAADPPDDRTGTFESISWSEIAEQFENGTRDSLFQYPSRSVVHLTDFIRSLKEAEGMDAPIDEDELNERLRLYFEHSDLIQQVQQANSQFESDFEDISTYLQNSWVNELGKNSALNVSVGC